MAMGRCSSPRTQAPTHNSSTGQTRPQVCPMRFDSRMVVAAPSVLPVAILRMNVGTSMSVGHALMHGASKQYRQRFASTTASLAVYLGYVSVNDSCSCCSESGWCCMRLLRSWERPPRACSSRPCGQQPRLEGAAPGLRPAFDHYLRLREELETVVTLRVQVAEEAVAPPREREEGHGRRDAEVDADV